MKRITIYTIPVIAALYAVPALAWGPKLWGEGKVLGHFRSDVANLEKALTITDFEGGGEASRSFAKERDQSIQALGQSAAIIESMKTRVEELSRHFAAIRSGGGTQDDPNELETFCASQPKLDLSYQGITTLVSDAYDTQAEIFNVLKSKLDPVASELWAANEAWAPAKSPLPGGYDPESQSAREYLENQHNSQVKAHNAKLASQQRLLDAATHAGWAAKRIAELKERTLERVNKTAPWRPATVSDAQAACKLAVARIRENRMLAGTSGASGRGKTDPKAMVAAPR